METQLSGVPVHVLLTDRNNKFYVHCFLQGRGDDIKTFKQMYLTDDNLQVKV